MSVELFIYLASVSGQLKSALMITSLLAGTVSSFFLAIVYLDTCEDSYHKSKIPVLGKVLAISTLSLFISCLLPESKTLYLMAGAAYGKEAIQSETAVKVKKIIDSQLDKILEELDKK